MVEMKVAYQKFKRYLMEERGYTEEEAAHSIDQMRGADPEIKQAFGEFWQTGELPSRLCGMDVKALMKHRNMDPVAALLAINWLKEQPRAARWAMMHPKAGMMITKQDIEEIYRIAAQNGWDLDADMTEHSQEDLEI